jgi:hypothetical protein
MGEGKGPYWTVVPKKKKKKKKKINLTLRCMKKKIIFSSYFTNKNSIFSLHSALMCRTWLRKNSDCFSVKRSAVDLCKGEALFFCEVRTEVEIQFSWTPNFNYCHNPPVRKGIATRAVFENTTLEEHLPKKENVYKVTQQEFWQFSGSLYTLIMLRQDCTNLQRHRRHSKILDTRWEIWSQFHHQNPQILEATVQNFVAQWSWCPVFLGLLITIIKWTWKNWAE